MINSTLFRRIELQLLMNLTASAFGQQSKRIWTLPVHEALKCYADYTGSMLHTGADGFLLQRMNSRALKMGCLLRRLFFVRDDAAAQRLIVALYRNIGITLSFSDGQQLRFHRCFFSGYYSPAACRAASALDDGIIRGITGLTDCRLRFSQRITEGCPCCKARLNMEMKK